MPSVLPGSASRLPTSEPECLSTSRFMLSSRRWQIGTALYILGLIAYQGALTFWTAAFPGLARDLPELKESEGQLARGEIRCV